MNLSKEQKFGAISSLIFLILFTGLLMIFGFTAPFPPPEEEGILINFGTDEMGMGAIEPQPASQTVQTEATIPEPSTLEPTTQADNTEEVSTQDYEEAAALAEKKRKEKVQQEELKKKRLEEEKRKQEELAEQKRAEERRIQKEKQDAIDKRAKNAFGGQNTNGDNTGEGVTEGTGNQGKPEGDINSNNRVGGSGSGNGISFNLNGRSSRSLPPPPKIHNTEGKVVVEVTVDQNGNVISARSGVRGSTISDAQLLDVAKKAALKAKFNVDKDAPAIQKGEITYFFGFE